MNLILMDLIICAREIIVLFKISEVLIIDRIEKKRYLLKTYKIGSFEVHLHCPKNTKLPEYNIEIPIDGKGMGYVEKIIDIWYYPPMNQEFINMFRQYKKMSKNIVPKQLQVFYKCLDKSGIDYLKPENHCNKYYKYSNVVLADFPYATDSFNLICIPDKCIVYLCGNESCIERVLRDLYAMMAEYFPIHGCAVSYKNKAICFLGDSNCGKSVLTSYLLELGMEYITDDEIFCIDNKIYSLNSIMQKRKMIDDGTIKKEIIDIKDQGYSLAVCSDIEEIYLLCREERVFYSQWFPCVAKQSSWWFLFICDLELLNNIISDKIDKSKKMILEMLSDAKCVTLDMYSIKNQSIIELCNWKKVLVEVENL